MEIYSIGFGIWSLGNQLSCYWFKVSIICLVSNRTLTSVEERISFCLSVCVCLRSSFKLMLFCCKSKQKRKTRLGILADLFLIRFSCSTKKWTKIELNNFVNTVGHSNSIWFLMKNSFWTWVVHILFNLTLKWWMKSICLWWLARFENVRRKNIAWSIENRTARQTICCSITQNPQCYSIKRERKFE